MTEIADDEEHQRAVKTALASMTASPPLTIEPLGRGNRKQTVLARFESRQPVVIQLCRDRHRLRTEATVLARIRTQTPVPVPQVLDTGMAGPVSFMITAYVPGLDLHEQFTTLDRTSQRRIVEHFGANLAHLHEQIRFDKYGLLSVVDGELTGETQDWPGWLTEYAQTAIARLPSEFDPMRVRLREACSVGPDSESPSAHLFPWDFRPGNTRVADGEITAILDWETPMAATPALSVAKAEYLIADWYVDDPDPLRTAFTAGYESVRAYPDLQPIHRVAAIADSAVDSNGRVTNPGYPELNRERAIGFHRQAFNAVM